MSYLDHLYQVPVNEDTNILNEGTFTSPIMRRIATSAMEKAGRNANSFYLQNKVLKSQGKQYTQEYSRNNKEEDKWLHTKGKIARYLDKNRIKDALTNYKGKHYPFASSIPYDLRSKFNIK